MNKGCFDVDFAKKTINVSASANAKASRGYGEEYDYLVRLTTQNPTFEIEVLPPKKVKQTYKGLTLALMREYVSIQDNCDELLPRFNAMQDLGEARGNKVATAKHWFLDTFTGITVAKAKETINAFYYNEVIEARSSDACPASIASNEADLTKAA